MSDLQPEMRRLSLNQMTIDKSSLTEAVDACMHMGIPWIGAWRHKIQPNPTHAGRVIKDAGLCVSSLCRGGMFPAATAQERWKRIEDNIRAIDEATAIGTDLLVLVNGAAPDRDIAAARQMVIEGIAEIQPYATQCGVRLAVEPLHPMFAAERSVVVTLAQANDIALLFDPQWVGVVVDVYHLWWDPQVYDEIARAARRIFAFHVSDWLVPTPSILMGRGLMGQGVIEIRKLRAAVEAAGYAGPIEVEIFNETLSQLPVNEYLRLIVGAYQQFV